jgi:transposase-like protein
MTKKTGDQRKANALSEGILGCIIQYSDHFGDEKRKLNELSTKQRYLCRQCGYRYTERTKNNQLEVS